MWPVCDPVQAFAWMAEGVRVITSNQRRQQYLSQAYGQFQQGQGRSVWPSPQILPWKSWWQLWQADACLQQGMLSPLPLTLFESRLCWQQVLDEDPASAHLLRPKEAAALAEQAWSWQRQYRLQVEPLEETEEYQQLCHWLGQYRQRLASLDRLDETDWFDWLLASVQQGVGELPDRLLLSGFEEVTPQQTELLQALADRGTQLYRLAAPEREVALYWAPCRDDQAELAAAVDWAEQWQGQRVALVVPDLARRRAALVRLLDDRFHPDWRQAPAQARPRCYNLSLGTALGNQPVIQTALRLLQLAGSQRLDLAELEAVLESPYWSGATDTDWMALCRRWRERCPRLLRKRDFLSYWDPKTPELQALVRLLNWHWPDSASAQTWAMTLAEFLQTSIQTARLNSHEFQAWQQLSVQLTALSQLDALLPACSLSRARRLLADLCQQSLFQPETLGNPWLQVLGPLEALGGEFEAVRILGMSQDAWPTSVRPQPFLPLLAQKRHRLPHADAEREREHCQWQLRQLQATTGQLVFSYPEQQSDRRLLPSRILPPAPILDLACPGPDLLHAQRAQPLPLSSQLDAQAPVWQPDERALQFIPALSWQARCPLAGFVFGRLHARAFPNWRTQLDAQSRGTLVHEILQAFWQQTQTQAELKALTTEQVDARLQGAIAARLNAFAQASPGWLSERQQAFLADSLRLPLLASLDLERARPRPFKVQSQEKSLEAEFEGFTFKARLDRIDELEDGSLVLIDYKTGSRPHFSQWLPESGETCAGMTPDELKALSGLSRRQSGLREPQLPCYSLILVKKPEQLAALAFIRIHADPEKAGLSALDVREALRLAKDKSPDWAQPESMTPLFRYWHYRLQQLAQQYRAGDAALRLKRRQDLEFAEDLWPVLRLDQALQGVTAPLTLEPGLQAIASHLLPEPAAQDTGL